MGFPVILMGLALVVFLVGGFLAPDLDGLGIAFISATVLALLALIGGFFAYGISLNH